MSSGHPDRAPAPGSVRAEREEQPAALMLAANLLLAIAWLAMSGNFRVENLVAGFIFGYVVLLVAQWAVGPSSYFSKTGKVIRFAAFYLEELLRANLRVAYDVVTPSHHMRPGIVAVPLDARSDAEITLLANLMTMTPGSLSLDVADDRSVLYVHSMFLAHPDAFRAQIKDDFERRVLELLR